MIARADIEGSKSNGASKKAWLPMPSIGLEKIVTGWGVGSQSIVEKLTLLYIRVT